VFVRTGSLWSQQAVLRASPAVSNQKLGATVSVSGDVVAAGIGDLIGNPPVFVFRRNGSIWSEEDQLHGSSTTNAFFGADLSLDGDLLAIAGPGGQGDRAYVFRYTSGAWLEETSLVGSGVTGDYFGSAVAASGDTVAVGAWGDYSNGRGIDPVGTTNTAQFSGAVYVFRMVGTEWTLEAFIKSSNSDSLDQFGRDLALAGDVLAVGALGEAGGGQDVGADETDNSASTAGAAYVFHRVGDTWAQDFYVKASNAESDDQFFPVALSRDTLVIGAAREDSSAIGIDGAQGNDDGAADSGAMYILR
jgi:hypothetical protein